VKPLKGKRLKLAFARGTISIRRWRLRGSGSQDPALWPEAFGCALASCAGQRGFVVREKSVGKVTWGRLRLEELIARRRYRAADRGARSARSSGLGARCREGRGVGGRVRRPALASFRASGTHMRAWDADEMALTDPS